MLRDSVPAYLVDPSDDNLARLSHDLMHYTRRAARNYAYAHESDDIAQEVLVKFIKRRRETRPDPARALDPVVEIKRLVRGHCNNAGQAVRRRASRETDVYYGGERLMDDEQVRQTEMLLEHTRNGLTESDQATWDKLVAAGNNITRYAANEGVERRTASHRIRAFRKRAHKVAAKLLAEQDA